MNEGCTVFAQNPDHAPRHLVTPCVACYQVDPCARSFSCWDHFHCLAFARLTGRESRRDIELWLTLFHRAEFRRTKAAIKLRSLLDRRG